MTDTSEDITVNDANTADTKPAREIPSFSEGQRVFINRGKHRGQNGTVVMVAADDQYAIKTDGGAAIVVNAASLREPQSVGLDPSKLAEILAEVRATLPPPSRHAIIKVATAVESAGHPGFVAAVEAAVLEMDAPQDN